jgi:hypothetical protein
MTAISARDFLVEMAASIGLSVRAAAPRSSENNDSTKSPNLCSCPLCSTPMVKGQFYSEPIGITIAGSKGQRLCLAISQTGHGERKTVPVTKQPDSTKDQPR